VAEVVGQFSLQMVEKPRHVGDNLLDCRSESDSIEEGKMRHD